MPLAVYLYTASSLNHLRLGGLTFGAGPGRNAARLPPLPKAHRPGPLPPPGPAVPSAAMLAQHLPKSCRWEGSCVHLLMVAWAIAQNRAQDPGRGAWEGLETGKPATAAAAARVARLSQRALSSISLILGLAAFLVAAPTLLHGELGTSSYM